MAAKEPLRVLISGGGIAGLTFARALICQRAHLASKLRNNHNDASRLRPLTIDIFEQAPELRPTVGGSITLQSSRGMLRTLGAWDPIQKRGVSVNRVITRSPTKLLTDLELINMPALQHMKEEGFLLCVLRSRILEEMNKLIFHNEPTEGESEADYGGPFQKEIDRLRDEGAATKVELHLGKRVLNVAQNKDGVLLTLSDHTSARGDVLIGADGIRSVTRSILQGPSNPQFSGHLSMGGGSYGNTDPEAEEFVQYLSPQGAYAIRVPAGDGSVSWGIIETTSEEHGEDWANAFGRVNPEVIREKIQKYWPNDKYLLQLLDNTPTEKLSMRGLYHRKSFQHPWFKERVGLLGDACHSMLPYMGQGANCAIIDAGVLSRTLLESTHFEVSTTSIATAFQQYQNERKSFSDQTVKMSEFMGSVMTLRNPLLVKVRDFLYPLMYKMPGLPQMFVKQIQAAKQSFYAPA